MDAKTRNSSAAPMVEHQPRDRTSLGVLATPRNSDAAPMASRKPRVRTSRVVSRFRLHQEWPAAWTGTEVPAETSPSSGTTIRSTVVAHGSGTEAVRAMVIDSRPRKNAKRSAFNRKEEVSKP